MSGHAAITVSLPRDEAEQMWRSSPHRPQDLDDAAVSFKDAPGDRGTEIHVDLQDGGKLGGLARLMSGSEPLAKVKDGLRRFKAWAETGEIPRSDATPEGELTERKLKQRPAQPPADAELEQAGVR